MAARRLVAVLVAVALIVIAVVIRNGMDNGDGESGGGGAGTPKLVCTPELERFCSGLVPDVDLTVEEPGVTAARLEKAGNDLGIDGWLTPGPWAEIAVAGRRDLGKVPGLAIGKPLARSQIGLAAWPDRYSVLIKSCANAQISWKCVGDVAGKGTWANAGGPPEWGQIKIG